MISPCQLEVVFQNTVFQEEFLWQKKIHPEKTRKSMCQFSPPEEEGFLGGMLSPPPSHPGCFTHLTGTASKASVSLSPPSSAFEKNLVFYTPKMGEEIC